MIHPPSPPVPPVPSNLDLRDFGYMPLDVVRLYDSDLMALASGDEFRAAVALWCKAWHQVPAGSLPTDERLLAHLAGFGRDLAGWRKVSEMALRGFVLCDDGRLYHHVICEKALEAAESKQEFRSAKDAGAARKQREREDRARMFATLKEGGVTVTWNTPTATLRELVTNLSRVTGADQSQSNHDDIAQPVTPDVTAIKGREEKGREGNRKIEDVDSARAGDHFEVVTRDLCAIPELQTHPVAVNPVIAAIWTLVQQGYDLKTQIIPSIRKQTQTARNPIKSWGYFVRGIIDDNAIAKQEAPNGTRTPRRKPSASTAMRDAFDDLQSAIAGPNSTA